MAQDRDIDLIRSPEFWRRAWAQDRKASRYAGRKIRTDQEAMTFWDQIAPSYGKHAHRKSEERITTVLEMLDRGKMLTPGSTILDVGCGPGTYALPFAKRAKTVTALDGAKGMCDILKQRVKAKNINNIKIINQLWKDLPLDAHNMTHAFDLVFASMTPAVFDCETLLKLNQASKKHCCLITSTNGHTGKAREMLRQRIFGEENNSENNSLIYIFNLLYSMDCRPTLQYMDSEWVREDTTDKAVERFTRSFWLYTEITPEIKNTITQFVNERSANGLFREKTKSRLGVLTWNANPEATQEIKKQGV